MKKKIIALLLVAAMVLSLAACGGNTTPTQAPETKAPETQAPATEAPTEAPTEEVTEPEETLPVYEKIGADDVYERQDDDDVYYSVLADYEEKMMEAKAAATNDERFVLYAQAEAMLLDSAVMIPTTTQGGAYAISRAAYRTVPYVNWGNDDDRVGTLVLADKFITKEDRAALIEQWNKALAGEGEYDPAAYLESKGYAIQHDYTTSFSTAPVTIDWLNTSSQSDTEITVNVVDGLVQYDNLGTLQPKLAESWEVSEDGTKYTFHIRKDAKWYTSEGKEYADVTANDFVAGFHHMLDTDAGLDFLVDGVVAGVHEYLAGESFDGVGVEATDDYTLVYTLTGDFPYFMTMLTYSIFLPINEQFYLSRGGVYGRTEYQEASADTNKYTFGKSEDVASQVYCGPYLLQKLQKDSEILIVKNENYYDADKINLNSIKWVFDAGENLDATYDDAVKGVYAGITLSTASLQEKAKNDGYFDTCSYISDTTSTTYFGGLNLNRGTFALESGNAASPKDEAAKISTQRALWNKNFRKALQHAFDKATQNATSRGEDLKNANLRNMYTHPEFVKLENDVTVDGDSFAAGTLYGDLVQFYCDKLGCKVNVKDGVDGWYQPEAAKEYLAAAKEELGEGVNWPIQIDVVYLSSAEVNTAQAQAYKAVIEQTLGAENVVVNLVETTTAEDFYACGYRAANGAAGNYDMFYGSGWGPDFGDPCTYLDTFLGEGVGYMDTVIGLY